MGWGNAGRGTVRGVSSACASQAVPGAAAALAAASGLFSSLEMRAKIKPVVLLRLNLKHNLVPW